MATAVATVREAVRSAADALAAAGCETPGLDAELLVAAALGVPRERLVYVGDGGSDLHVMLHANRGEGLTIAVSQSRRITQVARRTVISDDALSVLVPIVEELGGYGPTQVRRLFERHGLVIQEWDRVRTDWLTIRESPAAAA